MSAIERACASRHVRNIVVFALHVSYATSSFDFSQKPERRRRDMNAPPPPPPQIATNEKYSPWQRDAMLAAFAAGDRNIVNTFRVPGVTEKSMRQNLLRWGNREQERGHLDNHMRGARKGVKFVLDGDLLDVIKRATGAFPDIYAAEMVKWFRAQGLR